VYYKKEGTSVSKACTIVTEFYRNEVNVKGYIRIKDSLISNRYNAKISILDYY
jgi:hypothetical protein